MDNKDDFVFFHVEYNSSGKKKIFFSPLINPTFFLNSCHLKSCLFALLHIISVQTSYRVIVCDVTPPPFVSLALTSPRLLSIFLITQIKPRLTISRRVRLFRPTTTSRCGWPRRRKLTNNARVLFSAARTRACALKVIGRKMKYDGGPRSSSRHLLGRCRTDPAGGPSI